ncbi:GNAT family N-acetyltransferase [Gynuella sp.]|uniref:GNAT family N-acetyltransferase n=1 Tax=Gynuella sp. TaxID=2969146 RepID=UPI003D0C6341
MAQLKLSGFQLKPRKISLPRVQLFRKGKVIQLRFLQKLIEPQSNDVIAGEISSFPCLGKTRDGKQIYLCQFSSQTALLKELGRLREIAFRAVGEGSGKPYDIDQFDFYYEHLILWDERNREIVGAYRLGNVQKIRQRSECTSLYTETLFQFNPSFDEVLSSGLELGRSFVQPKYWGNRSLDYLWYGIGAYLKYHPEIRYLYGPVSISGQLPGRAKALIASFYASHFNNGQNWVSPKNAYKIPKKYREICHFGADYRGEFKELQERLKRMGLTVPTLYKQYAEVAEIGGVTFCAFNIDVDFGYCLDGFVVVDLSALKENKRKRYLGE